MLRDPLQRKLQVMERENPSPSLEDIKPTLDERIGFLGRYLSGAIEQIPQRNLVENKTLRKILYHSRVTWIILYAKDRAGENANIQARHYRDAIREIGNAFLVNESDTSLRNLFMTLKLIALMGKSEQEKDIYTNKVFHGISPDGHLYSVKYQSRCKSDEVSVIIGDRRFSISDESFLNSRRVLGERGLSHYGDEIPQDILTQLLDGRIDKDR